MIMTISTHAMTLSTNCIAGDLTANMPLLILQTRFHQHLLKLKWEWQEWCFALFTVKKEHSESCFSFHVYNTVINKPVVRFCKSLAHCLICPTSICMPQNSFPASSKLPLKYCDGSWAQQSVFWSEFIRDERNPQDRGKADGGKDFPAFWLLGIKQRTWTVIQLTTPLRQKLGSKKQLQARPSRTGNQEGRVMGTSWHRTIEDYKAKTLLLALVGNCYSMLTLGENKNKQTNMQ